MSRRSSQTLPPRLDAGRQRFEHWRSQCEGRSRIPEKLWVTAAMLAQEFGVHRTSKALRLNYDALKRRVSSRQGEWLPGLGSASVGQFVEVLSVGAGSGSRECVVELEDGRGARMRIELKGAEAADLSALVGSVFRGGR